MVDMFYWMNNVKVSFLPPSFQRLPQLTKCIYMTKVQELEGRDKISEA